MKTCGFLYIVVVLVYLKTEFFVGYGRIIIILVDICSLNISYLGSLPHKTSNY
jgi:hypothetical protein